MIGDMGRGTKKLVHPNGIDRRGRGHYKTPDEVAEFLARSLLSIRGAGNKVLDPCVGTGTLLQPFCRLGLQTHGVDIDDWRQHEIGSFEQGDFLDIYRDEFGDSPPFGGKLAEFDYFVMNPPYNCHESDYIRSNKSWLQAAFHDLGVANMYAMFIAGVVKAASPGAVIGVITLDSFLTARAHEPLRRLLTSECEIRTLILCPPDLFRDQGADVRTCILVLVKGAPQEHPVEVLDRAPTSSELFDNLSGRNFERLPLSQIVLDDPRDRGEFAIGVPSDVRALFDGRRLGEVFPCITGVSTGNDAKYLSKMPTSKFAVPFYKNPGSRRFGMEPDAYLRTDFDEVAKHVPNFMVRNRSSLLSPGVSCSSMGLSFSAVYRPEGTAFGVNPNIVCADSEAWWLLSYLNSRLATYLVRGVLLRTNMVTSGYVSRVPLPEFSDSARVGLDKLGRAAYAERTSAASTESLRHEIDRLVYDNLGLSAASVQRIDAFNGDLPRSV